MRGGSTNQRSKTLGCQATLPRGIRAQRSHERRWCFSSPEALAPSAVIAIAAGRLGSIVAGRQRVRIVLSVLGSVAIPPPAQKTFEAEEKLGTRFEESASVSGTMQSKVWMQTRRSFPDLVVEQVRALREVPSAHEKAGSHRAECFPSFSRWQNTVFLCLLYRRAPLCPASSYTNATVTPAQK